ncbi:MAG: hypothetical protein HOQ32_03775 [Lysobacter sp.]|nr:hypothetical protein [Lysobacter sp.]
MRLSSAVVLAVAVVIPLFAPSITAHAGKNELTASDYIRPIQEVVKDSSGIMLIHMRSAQTGTCGIAGAKGVVEYEGQVGQVYKGETPVRKTVKFCGYGGLTINSAYLIMFDPSKASRPFFSPDAVFLEHMPERYYRMVSYESAEFTVEGKAAVVAAIYEPSIAELLRKLIAEKVKAMDIRFRSEQSDR